MDSADKFNFKIIYLGEHYFLMRILSRRFLSVNPDSKYSSPHIIEPLCHHFNPTAIEFCKL